MALNLASLQAASWQSTMFLAKPPRSSLALDHAKPRPLAGDYGVQLSFMTAGTSSLWHRQASVRSIEQKRTRGRRQCLVQASLSPEDIHQREEARWHREEQRWLREEERWMRAEKRWEDERSALQQEIRVLKAALAEVAASQPGLLERLKTAWGSGRAQSSEEHIDTELVYRSLTQSSAEAPSSPPTFTAPSLQPPVSTPSSVSQQVSSQSANASPAEVSASEILAKIPAADVIAAVASRTVDGQAKSSSPAVPAKEGPAVRTLGLGAEGSDVNDMQLALEAQGFYAGEDDILNSYYSEDTESAVKTWQATVGVREDGVMTADLLAVLYGEATLPPPVKKTKASPGPASPSGERAPRATRDVPEIERYARTDIEAGLRGKKRVFLLGENRWEEPDRVANNNGSSSSSSSSASGKTTAGMTAVASRCHVCRGEGSLVCMECEGTGDLNVEEQFLDWAGQDARCLYCGGTGATKCDTCNGAGTL